MLLPGLVAVVTALWAVPVAAAAPADGSVWSGYGGGPAHNGYNGAEQVLSPASAPGYRVLWRSQSIPGTDEVSQPVVWGNTVIAGRHGAIRAFDLGTGAVLWSVPGSVRGLAPPVQGGTAFVLRGTRVVGLDVADGHQVWQSPTRPRLQSDGPSLTATPTRVFASGQGITAFDRRTGAIAWTFLDRASQWSSPSVVGNEAVSIRDGVTVVAFDATTGVRRWTDRSDGASSTLDGFPVAFSGQQLVAPDPYGTLVSLNARTGHELWRGVPGHGSVGWSVRQLAFDGCSAWFVDRVDSERYDAITSVRGSDGAVRWSFTVGPGFGDSHNQPLGVSVGGGVVAFTLPGASAATTLVLLDGATGRLLRRLPVGTDGERPPSIADGRILVGTGNRLVVLGR